VSRLSGWSYRKSLTINGSSAGAVTDYQIRVKVHYGSGTDSGEDVYLNGMCRTDFGDIRFTDSGGVTELRYWMEEKVDGDYAVFWVKVPSIPASPGTAAIYIYYGKSDATTTSNGDATFEFFADFEACAVGDNGDCEGLDHAEGTWIVDVEDGNKIYKQTDETYPNTDSKTSDSWSDFEAQVKLKRTYYSGTGEYDVGLSFRETDSDNRYFVGIIPDGNYIRLWKFVSGVLHPLGTYNIALEDNTYYWLRVKAVGNHIIVDFSSDGKNWAEIFNITDDSFSSGKIGLYTFRARASFDDIRVRKYVDPEPSLGTLGSEETPHAPTIKYWDGSAWKDIKSIKYWDGSAWQTANGAYYWDGTQWVQFWTPVVPFGSVVRSASSPSAIPIGIGGDSSVIWHCDTNVDKVYELSTADFSVVRSARCPDSWPNGIGGDSSVIWHCDDHDIVYELSTADFSVVRSAGSPSTAPTGIGGDSSVIWYCDATVNKVYELSTFNRW